MHRNEKPVQVLRTARVPEMVLASEPVVVMPLPTEVPSAERIQVQLTRSGLKDHTLPVTVGEIVFSAGNREIPAVPDSSSEDISSGDQPPHFLILLRCDLDWLKAGSSVSIVLKPLSPGLEETPQQNHTSGETRHEHDLTPCEIKTARLAATGCSNTEIAQRLCITEATIKTHLGHVFKKTDLKRRSQLITLFPDLLSPMPSSHSATGSLGKETPTKSRKKSRLSSVKNHTLV